MNECIEVERITKVFGDRVLVKKLDRPKKKGALFIPEHLLKETASHQKLWWGEIVKFGLDTRIGEASNLKVGDWIGIESLGQHHSAVKGEDDHDYIWVPEEYIAAKDNGSVREIYERA